ncbi:hypothetical protein CFOL_v3_13837 [Cephalotus follicularis]|uniref:Uncharacterized protein n=1 Tax=Cephalotus follicularis TaxID=3775 RepID=A0A1Q3BR11_CEPFO|nr:hypothetical protein CFOL_v3_13837 [Cephalotus follicularis]
MSFSDQEPMTVIFCREHTEITSPRTLLGLKGRKPYPWCKGRGLPWPKVSVRRRTGGTPSPVQKLRSSFSDIFKLVWFSDQKGPRPLQQYNNQSTLLSYNGGPQPYLQDKDIIFTRFSGIRTYPHEEVMIYPTT